MDQLDHPSPGLTLQFINSSPLDFQDQEQQNSLSNGATDDNMDTAPDTAGAGGLPPNVTGLSTTIDLPPSIPPSLSTSHPTSSDNNNSLNHDDDWDPINSHGGPAEQARYITDQMESILDWTTGFVFGFTDHTELLLPAFSLCHKMLKLHPYFSHHPINSAHNDTNTNILGVLNSLSRELGEVKNEMARFNKTTAKATRATAQDQNTSNRQQANNNKSSPSTTASTNATNTTTYAATAANNANKATSPSKVKTTTAKLERMVIRFQGNPIPVEDRPPPLQLLRMINSRLTMTPTAKGLSVIGASWNQSGNCVLSFPANSSPVIIEQHARVLREAVAGDRPSVANRDVRWSKVVVHRVLTGLYSEGRVFPPDILLQDLTLNNSINKIKITRSPDWIRKPDDISSMHSSISFAFEDPSGSLVKSFVRQPLFLFGERCVVKEWKDKPSISQCRNCWMFGHSTSGCRRKSPRCRLCAEVHKEEDHRVNCSHCISTGNTGDCVYRYCANCKGDHAADDSGCPSRTLNKAPTGQQNDGWTTVRHR